jgi:hypothetical protein
MNVTTMSNNFIEMTFDEWCETYKPIVNHIDTNASFDNGYGGLMFETYGEEVDFVKEQPENRIWMYGDGDDGAHGDDTEDGDDDRNATVSGIK